MRIQLKVDAFASDYIGGEPLLRNRRESLPESRLSLLQLEVCGAQSREAPQGTGLSQRLDQTHPRKNGREFMIKGFGGLGDGQVAIFEPLAKQLEFGPPPVGL